MNEKLASDCDSYGYLDYQSLLYAAGPNAGSRRPLASMTSRLCALVPKIGLFHSIPTSCVRCLCPLNDRLLEVQAYYPTTYYHKITDLFKLKLYLWNIYNVWWMCQVVNLMMSLSLLLPKKIQNNLYKFLVDSQRVKIVKSRVKRSMQSYLEFFRITNRLYELCTFIFMEFYNGINRSI